MIVKARGLSKDFHPRPHTISRRGGWRGGKWGEATGCGMTLSRDMSAAIDKFIFVRTLGAICQNRHHTGWRYGFRRPLYTTNYPAPSPGKPRSPIRPRERLERAPTALEKERVVQAGYENASSTPR